MAFDITQLRILNISGQGLESIVVANMMLSCLDCLIKFCLYCLLVNVLPTANKLIFSLNYWCELSIDI